MNCSNYHESKTSPDCPWCIIRMLVRALSARDPTAPELTPATELLIKATHARQRERFVR